MANSSTYYRSEYPEHYDEEPDEFTIECEICKNDFISDDPDTWLLCPKCEEKDD